MSPAGVEQLVVVTGMSGAGKTTALRALDDIGFYCVDNLPPTLATETVRTCTEGGLDRVALGMDVRVGAFLHAATAAVKSLSQHPAMLNVLFVDAADDVLVRRFNETRRPHPMLAERASKPNINVASMGDRTLGVADAVALEREQLGGLRALSTDVVDTTHMSVHDLRRSVLEMFTGDADEGRMQLFIKSFGFKYGAPLDSNVVFDVRFLPNPYFDPQLKELTGNDKAVSDFVLATEACDELLDRLEGLLRFSLPRYQHEGKSYLTIAIGCTGGRHRSVAIANELGRRFSDDGQKVGIVHRDVKRGL